MRTGLLLMIIGTWLFLRTIKPDVSGNTLVDHLIGKH